MMAQRFGYIFLLWVGLILFLVACGGTAPEPAPAATEAPAQEESVAEEEPAPEPTEAPAPTEAPEPTEEAAEEAPTEEEAAEEVPAQAEPTDEPLALATLVPPASATAAPSATRLPVVPSVVPATPMPVL